MPIVGAEKGWLISDQMHSLYANTVSRVVVIPHTWSGFCWGRRRTVSSMIMM